MPAGPLTGHLVVDLSRARSGPTCTRQLADLGADVVWVGHPTAGDLGGSDQENLRRDTRSILLDLSRTEGLEVLGRLVDRADVLVENFRPGVTERLGIDPPALLARNPRLVIGSISGFGHEGPWRHRAAVDQVVQGMSGMMSVTGPPGSGPWRAGLALSDVAAGTLLAQGVLAALLDRVRTGSGQWVRTSLLEAAIAFMDFQAVRWLADGEVPTQAGNDHPTVFPMGTFPTADGHVTVAAVTDWSAFVAALADARLADPRFATPAGRVEHRPEVDRLVRENLAEHGTDEWVERLAAAGLPAGPVLTVDEVFAHPQVTAIDPTVTVIGPDGATTRLLGHPVHLAGRRRDHRAAPRPGRDTRAVLEELGYAPAEIDDLVEGGVAPEGRRSTW